MSTTTIYIEEQIKKHPRTVEFLLKFPDAKLIEIEKYSDVFNRKNQNFRAQKLAQITKRQTWILAKKEKGFVQKNPEFCVSCAENNFYFSHLLNCPFDCEYCFLQGMYKSAFYLFFINFEDFEEEIKEKALSEKSTMFFSSYDADGLALDYFTGFTKHFIPFFQKEVSQSILEIRTKSSNIHNITKLKPTQNTVIAWTLSAQEIQEAFEKNTASLTERVKALKELQNLGWKVAIRIEPLIFVPDWKEVYAKFFEYLKQEIDFEKVENIYFGVFKLPKDFLKKMQKMYPQSKLFFHAFEEGIDGELSYPQFFVEEFYGFIYENCEKLIDKGKIFYVKY